MFIPIFIPEVGVQLLCNIKHCEMLQIYIRIHFMIAFHMICGQSDHMFNVMLIRFYHYSIGHKMFTFCKEIYCMD